MILLSESREGIGNDDFASIFTDYDSNAEREAALRRKYTIGGFMGYHSAVIAEDNNLLVLSNLDQELIRSMGMTPVSSLEEALEIAASQHGGDLPLAYIMPHAGTTLPILCQ